jgi:4a-hydroxytetrahydrobiopterin dehydratase
LEQRALRPLATAPTPPENAPPPERVLGRSFHFGSYAKAAAFVASVVDAAEAANHHPNLSLVHHCVSGADVAVELYTYAVGGLTQFDVTAAESIEGLARDGTAPCAPCASKL